MYKKNKTKEKKKIEEKKWKVKYEDKKQFYNVVKKLDEKKRKRD